MYLSGRFYIPSTFVRGVRDSRSGGRVLLRFLPVRFESCLNDASRLRNTAGVFQEKERRREGDKGRVRTGSGVGGWTGAGRRKDRGHIEGSACGRIVTRKQ